MKKSDNTGIALVNPDNEMVTVDAGEVNKALGLGYRQATQDDIAVHNYLDANKGVSGAVKVALGQAADEALMGVPETIKDYTDAPLEAAKREAIKKQHDIANTIGGVIGFGASTLYGGPLAKLGTKALGLGANVAERIVGERIANAAASVGSALTASDIGKAASGIAGNLINSGAEGAALMAPQAVTEAAFGDYDQAAETLLAGGLMGSAFQGAIELGKGAAKGTGYLLGNLKSSIGGGESIKKMEEADKTDLIGNLFKDVPAGNKAEIEAAAGRLGAVPTKGMLSANPVVRGTESSLYQSPSLAGELVKKDLNQVYKPVKEVTDQLLTPEVSRTLYETGDMAQKQLLGRITERQAELSKVYTQLEDRYGSIELAKSIKEQAKQEIMELDAYRLGPAKAKAEELMTYIDNAETIGDVKKLRTLIGGMYSPVAPTIEKKLITESYDVFSKMREKALGGIKVGTAEETAALQSAVKTTDKAYAESMKEFGVLDNILGGRESKSLSQIATKISEQTAEQLSKKLFNMNNVDGLLELKAKFPEVFDTIKAYKISELAEKSMYKGEISPAKFVTSLKKVPLEARLLMLGEEGEQKFRDIKTLMDAMPDKIGPSGTPQGLQFLDMLNVAFNVKEGLRYIVYNRGATNAVYHSLGLVEKTMKYTAKKLDSLERYAKTGEIPKKDISLTARQIAAHGAAKLFIGDEKDKTKKFDKAASLISQMYTDPSALQGVTSVHGSLSSNGAPNVANAYNAKSIAAIKYLYESMPKRLSEPGVFGNKKWKPSDYQLAKFDRQFAAVDNPFGIIEDLQNGTLTKDKVQAVQAVYPKLYGQIKQRIINVGIEQGYDHLAYNSKLQMAVLLDIPMLKPGEVQGLQNSYTDNLDQKQEDQANQPMKRDVKLSTANNMSSDLSKISNRERS